MVIVSWLSYSPSLLPPFPGMYFFPPFSSVPMPGPSSPKVSFRIGIYSCAWETSIYPGDHGEMTRGDKGARACWTQCAEPVQGAKPNWTEQLGRRGRACQGCVDLSTGGWTCGRGEWVLGKTPGAWQVLGENPRSQSLSQQSYSLP